jgi:hypothetical protein
MRARNIKLRLAMILIAGLIALSSIGVTQAAWFSIRVPYAGLMFGTTNYYPYAVSGVGDSCHPSDPGVRWVYFRVPAFVQTSRLYISNPNLVNDAHLIWKGRLDGAYEFNGLNYTIKLCGLHEYGADAWRYILRYK